MLAYLLLWAISCYSQDQLGDTLFSEDFEIYSNNQEWISEETFVQATTKENRINKVLNTRYPPTEEGSPRTVKVFEFQNSVDEATLSFDFYFDNQFEFVKGGKLHGLGGGSPTSGCEPIVPNGWSVRIMWQAEGAPILYIYHQDRRNRCGDVFHPRSVFHLKPGQWYQAAIYIKMNTGIGSADGIATLSIDGKQIIYADGLNLSADGTTAIDKFLFSTFYGGNDSSWSPSKTTIAYFDNFSVRSGK